MGFDLKSLKQGRNIIIPAKRGHDEIFMNALTKDAINNGYPVKYVMIEIPPIPPHIPTVDDNTSCQGCFFINDVSPPCYFDYESIIQPNSIHFYQIKYVVKTTY